MYVFVLSTCWTCCGISRNYGMGSEILGYDFEHDPWSPIQSSRCPHKLMGCLSTVPVRRSAINMITMYVTVHNIKATKHELSTLPHKPHLQQCTNDIYIIPSCIHRCVSIIRRIFSPLDISKGIPEMSCNHFRCLDTLNKPRWGTLGRVDVRRGDAVNA